MKQIRYTAEQKRWAVEQMKPPLNRTVVEVAKETGITEVSLRTWRDAARQGGQFVPAGQPSERWSSSEKFRVVLETAPLSEQETAAYCRAKGVLPEYVQQWRQACEQANDSAERVGSWGGSSIRTHARGSVDSSVSCAARTKLWRRRPRCWYSEKKPTRSGARARTPDQHPRSRPSHGVDR